MDNTGIFKSKDNTIPLSCFLVCFTRSIALKVQIQAPDFYCDMLECYALFWSILFKEVVMLRRMGFWQCIVIVLVWSIFPSIFAQQNQVQPQAFSPNGLYTDLYLGYGYANWTKFTDKGHGAWAHIGGIRPRSNATGAFNWGADLGYQFLPYAGLEFGYFHPSVVTGDSLNVSTPYIYMAGKASLPLFMDRFSIYAKLGAAYRSIHYSGPAAVSPYKDVQCNWQLIYGLGTEYYLSSHWKVSAQWLEMPKETFGAENTGHSAKQVPRLDQLLFGLGFLFSI